MKIITGIILSILILTTTFSALAEEEATTVNAQKKSYSVAGCDPMPDCQIDFMIGQESSTLQRWLDQLKMKQLIDQLKTQQGQPAEDPETHNE